MMTSSSHKAVALFSGGLDSMLAVLTLLRYGIPVRAVQFTTPFDTRSSIGSSFDEAFCPYVEQRLFDVTVRHLGLEMLSIVREPKHGHGKNMNPCIDCRIMMLTQAKHFMDTIGADFIVTGEVLGQRPMSQRRDMLYHIDKEAGVSNKVLRPLSAKLLRETFAEQKGIVNRERLFSFSGRSRKLQMSLAAEYGLNDYPAPAGGCLLTEPNYAFRLEELMHHNPDPVLRDINLLRVGRHFRFSPDCKIIVGRDMSENAAIEALVQEGDCLLRVDDHGSPLTLVSGKVDIESLQFAAAVCARYSDAKNLCEVPVRVNQRGKSSVLIVAPARDDVLDETRIGRDRKCSQATV